MDLLTTILACSLYLEDDALVRAIAESSSEGNPYAVIDASADPTEVDPPPLPKTTDAALTRARDLIARGGHPLLGVMQVPPVWLEAFGRDLRDGFDACTSVAVGSAMVSQFAFECRRDAPSAHGDHRGRKTSADAHVLRPCILRRYQEAAGMSDFFTVTSLELRYQRLRAPAVTDAPIFATQASNWGPLEILVSSLSSIPPSGSSSP